MEEKHRTRGGDQSWVAKTEPQDTGTGEERVVALGCVGGDGLPHNTGIRNGKGRLDSGHASPIEVIGCAANWLWGRVQRKRKNVYDRWLLAVSCKPLQGHGCHLQRWQLEGGDPTSGKPEFEIWLTSIQVEIPRRQEMVRTG